MCFGLDILSTGAAAKRAAAAAEEQARQARMVAAGQNQASEAAIAQQKATQQAQDLLSKPAETTSVALGTNTAAIATVDPVTGRRRTVRSTFQLAAGGGASSGAGVSL